MAGSQTVGRDPWVSLRSFQGVHGWFPDCGSLINLLNYYTYYIIKLITLLHYYIITHITLIAMLQYYTITPLKLLHLLHDYTKMQGRQLSPFLLFRDPPWVSDPQFGNQPWTP